MDLIYIQVTMTDIFPCPKTPLVGRKLIIMSLEAIIAAIGLELCLGWGMVII
jgi:hypothetical protein